MTIINIITYYIKIDGTNFKAFYVAFNSKITKLLIDGHKNSINLINKKRTDKKRVQLVNDTLIIVDDKDDDWELIWENNKFDKDDVENYSDIYFKLMDMTNSNIYDVIDAMFGTGGNIKHAFLYLNNKEKYKNYYFDKTDDNIIINMKNTDEYKQLIQDRGYELIKEREDFLS